MNRYESKQVKINQPAEGIYNALSDFNNFTPILGNKVKGWQASEDSCSFKVQGMEIRLLMVEKVFPKLIKLTGDESSPMKFSFWIQLASAGPADTRLRLVLDIELNMMMKMLIGGKLQEAVDTMAEKIAESFNNMPPVHGGIPDTNTDPTVN